MAERRKPRLRWSQRFVTFLAVSYAAVLILYSLALWLVAERWWVTAVALFLPRWPLALPLPVIVLFLVWVGPRKWLWLQAAMALLLLFPLMGYVLPRPGSHPDGPKLRVLSCNVNSGFSEGYAKIGQEISAVAPDVVLLQELFINPDELVKSLHSTFPQVQVSTQFLVASRFPIVSTEEPSKLTHESRLRSARSIQYVIDTPLGRLAFYNVHPVSPRGAFYAIRGNGLRKQILSGGIFSGSAAGTVRSHMDLRDIQLEAACELARRETYPVVFAGDLNLVGLSRTWRGCLSEYQDGFSEAGSGFGYTYPFGWKGWSPWMRLDHILASDQLEFTEFKVVEDSVSDHFCVAADLVRSSN
jgi:endonuclease/exonuclease/phosphatase family metal-dependent hydrolase